MSYIIYIYIEREIQILPPSYTNIEISHRGSPLPSPSMPLPRACLLKPWHGVGWGGVNPYEYISMMDTEYWIYIYIYILGIYICIEFLETIKSTQLPTAFSFLGKTTACLQIWLVFVQKCHQQSYNGVTANIRWL